MNIDKFPKKVVSGSEFARYLKVSRQNISYQLRKGAIARRSDGKYDLSNPVNQNYIREHSGRVKLKSAQNRINNEPGTVGERKEAAEIQAKIQKTGDISYINKAEADRLKILEEIEAKRIKNRTMRNELIEKELVRRIFAQLHQIDVNGFRTLASNASSAIAAVIKIEDQTAVVAIEKIIDKEVFKILEHVKITIKNFLSSVKNMNENSDFYEFSTRTEPKNLMDTALERDC
jgi:hypothetical protein